MITTDLTTLKINKLTKTQYETALAAGNINENELYMTPESEAESGGDYATKSDLNTHVNDTTLHTTADEKTKLAGIEANANKYVHPDSHAATMITEDSTHRFVTDAEKAAWSEKEVFIATYGVTSSIEIANARDNGKVVYVKQDSYYFPMTYSYGTSVHRFTGFIDSRNGKNIFCSNSGWGLLNMYALPTVTTDDNGKILQVVNGVWTAVNNLSTVSATTLLASNWDSTAKTYSFETDYPMATYDIEIALDSTATSEQAEVFNGAQIVGSATSNIIKAYGVVPTVDIPIILKVVKK